MNEYLGANLLDLIKEYISESNAELIRSAVVILGIVIVAIIANWVTKKFIIAILKQVIKKSKNKYDDVFLQKKVFHNLSHIVPALIIYYAIPLAFIINKGTPQDTKEIYETIISVVQSMCYIYMIIAVLVVINSFLNALHEIYQQIATKKKITLSIKGYIQVVKIIFIIIGIILIIAILLDKKPGAIFAGLGALAAVIILVFRDTILGFVASIQLSAYKMMKPGDWISMPSRNADGDVIDISLSTVKVQNFDKTISTIPTYALVTESFTNWTGMQESGGRRIKRAVNIDMSSIKFCTPEMIEKFSKIHLLTEYIDQKQKELKEYNEKNSIDNSVVVNGRRLTNIGTFRKYIEFYLKNNLNMYKKRTVFEDGVETVQYVTDENKKRIEEKPGRFAEGMTMLVRQLKPTETGVPIEVYVFTSTTSWADYEGIQSDLFDHLLAIVPEFELRVFQNPTGADFRALKQSIEKAN